MAARATDRAARSGRRRGDASVRGSSRASAPAAFRTPPVVPRVSSVMRRRGDRELCRAFCRAVSGRIAEIVISAVLDTAMIPSSSMNVTPDEQQLWAGIGGHFDSFARVSSEVVDNSIANFEGNSTLSTQGLVSLDEVAGDRVRVRTEDTGTGRRDFEPALRSGDRRVGDACRPYGRVPR